ncbi:hypothetical protein F0562_020403 [Nyssa sinensis]|uniref:Glycosyltransferase N-terminal domain-containing protein n=1 Tax=Nyssa sinensis TaxID=561372 RepID=A0A5J5BRP8_9ASTE|nr:hypothetical protein F0562_020403 [Nyssa sinensis]
MGGGSIPAAKPHAVCIPFPSQGHINPMLKLAKLLHYRGFHITFVHNEYNHKRLLKSRGPNSLDGLPDFRFQTIPDGLPPSDADATQDIPSLCESTSKTCLGPFRDLLSRLNDSSSSSNVPPVTCIVSDCVMSFTLKAAEELGIPEVMLWTRNASYLANGYVETTIDWISGMKNIRLRDLPNFIRTADSNDIMFNFLMTEAESSFKAFVVILNTFDAFEQGVLEVLLAMLPCVFSIGSLQLMLNQISDDGLKSISSNLWKEEPEFIEWLNSKQPNSVVYVSCHDGTTTH